MHTSHTPARRGASRVLAGLTAAALLATAACSTGGGGTNEPAPVDTEAQGSMMQDYAADMQFKAAEPIDVGILWTDWPETPVTDSWEIFNKIKEMTNVNMKPTHIPFSDHVEKRSLLISAGDAPDLIPLIYTGEEDPFVASGAVLPLSDYLDYMPNFKKYVEEWDLQEMVDQLKQSDGKLYMLPGLQEVSVPVFTTIIRKDVFDEVGAKVPETWDEMRDGLRLIKAKYPNSYPLADGFEGQSMLNYASHAWGAKAGWGFGQGVVLNDENKFDYVPTTEGYKEMVEYFHSLVEEGLLDVESFTAANTGSGAASVPEKFANDLVFAASGAAGTAQEFATALRETKGEGNFEVVQLPPPGGPAGKMIEPRNFWHGFMLNSKLKDSDNLIATIQFVDWLYYNQDAREFLRWGVEGEQYTKDGDGKITLKPEYSLKTWNINPGGAKDIEKDLGYSTFLSESTESRALKQSYNSPDFVAYMDAVLETRTPRDPYPKIPLNEDELEQVSLLSTPLKDSVDTNTLRFILGERPLSEYDAFITELEGQGLEQYLTLLDTAYQRFQDEIK